MESLIRSETETSHFRRLTNFTPTDNSHFLRETYGLSVNDKYVSDTENSALKSALNFNWNEYGDGLSSIYWNFVLFKAKCQLLSMRFQDVFLGGLNLWFLIDYWSIRSSSKIHVKKLLNLKKNNLQSLVLGYISSVWASCIAYGRFTHSYNLNSSSLLIFH